MKKLYIPIQVEKVMACKFTGSKKNFKEIQEWLGEDVFYEEDSMIFFQAVDGFPPHIMYKGDWIVVGLKTLDRYLYSNIMFQSKYKKF